MTIKNKVQLITYPDSLGGDLKALNKVLVKYFSDVFKGGVHVLPPYPSSGDRGFAPVTYFDIDPRFGSWEDIRSIGNNFDVMLDLMVNHISRKSVYFQDFLEKGRDSIYADMFITLDKIWKGGNPDEDDIKKIFLRRPKPYSSFTIQKTGKTEEVWTTFGGQDPSEQIDLDINSKLTRNLLKDFLLNFQKQNVKMVRLDAVGFVIKKPGTSCFFVEPEIYDFLDWIINLAGSMGIELLPEVHSDYQTGCKLADHGLWTYNFILPYMVLETLINKSGSKLKRYLGICPHKQFTMLDCHDGIPVKPDLDGFIKTEEAKRVVDICAERGANFSLIYSDMYKDDSGFDVHQIRCSYYSALGCDDDAYIAARAIQFFTPGIPQVYYIGLLAGENDYQNAERAGDGREINRHNYSMPEIEHELQRDVVKRLLKLIRFRNEYPAFDGDFKVSDSGDDEIKLSWQKDKRSCILSIDLKTYKSVIEYVDDAGQKEHYNL